MSDETGLRPRIRAALRDLGHRLLHEHAAPFRLGVAVGVGVVVGCSPFFGLHIWIGLGLAWVLRLNKAAVVLGSHVSFPPLTPFVAFACVQVGARLVHGRWLTLAVVDFAPVRLPSLLRTFLVDWLVGGLVVGAGLALPAFLVTFAVARRWRSARARKADPGGWIESVRRAVALYRGARRGHRGYVRFKVRMDPVYRLVCLRLGRVGTVVDLGTGLALLPALLAVRRQAEEIVAVEWDEAKVATARLACSGLPSVTLHAADARSFPLPPADAVLMVDLLHYYPVDEQRALLERAAAALRPGGLLVVRETCGRRGGRVRMTRLLEWLSVRFRWNRGPGLFYREREDLVADLSGLGLLCSLEAASSNLHEGNALVWALDRAPHGGKTPWSAVDARLTIEEGSEAGEREARR